MNFQLYLTDYRKVLANLPTDPQPTDIYGHLHHRAALGPAVTDAGLDLTKTSPVPNLVADIRRSCLGVPCYIAPKTTERVILSGFR